MTENCKPFLNTTVQHLVGEVGDMRIESLIGRVYYIATVLLLSLVFERHSRLKATTWLSKLSQSPSVGSNELVFTVAVVLVCDESDVWRIIRLVPKRIYKLLGRCNSRVGLSTG
jgi:hypothetical protein